MYKFELGPASDVESHGEQRVRCRFFRDSARPIQPKRFCDIGTHATDCMSQVRSMPDFGLENTGCPSREHGKYATLAFQRIKRRAIKAEAELIVDDKFICMASD